MDELPDLDALWNYSDPAHSERVFEAHLEALPQGTPAAYRAELLTQLARARALQRRFEDADATLDEAEAVPGGLSGRVFVRALLERGRIRNDLGETDRALGLFRRAWDAAREHGEHALALDAAHMLGYVSPSAESVRWNLEAIEIARASDDPDLHRWLGTLHMNLASHLMSLDRFEEAREACAAAERYRRARGQEQGARDARVAMAKALRLDGRAIEALALAEALLAEAGIDPAWNGYAHEEAAEALRVLDRPEEAWEHFRRAYPILAADPWFPPTDARRLERIRRLAGLS